jgi:hypothetical protein
VLTGYPFSLGLSILHFLSARKIIAVAKATIAREKRDDAESLISHGPSVRKGNWDDRNIKEMTVLTVESISSMFEKFLPAVEPYSQYFYWKYEQYELMSIVARLVNAKAHYTLYGFMTIIEIIYSYPNKRLQPKEFWLENIQSWFKARAIETKSGENNIQAVVGRGLLKGSIVAWKCIFPNEFNIKSRQFGFTNDFESVQALKQAIQYRDISIKSWIESLLKSENSVK